MTPLLDRRLLVAALAVSLALPLAPLGSHSAEAQGDCQDLRNRPLWISNVTFFETDGDENDETFVNAHGNGSVYAEEGTELRAIVDVENRYPSGCTQSTGDLTNELNIQVRYINDPSAQWPSADNIHVSDNSLSCASRLTPQQSCEEEIRLPSSVNEEVTGPDGEHRLRIIVYDDDADDMGQAEENDTLEHDPSPVDDPDNCANTEQDIAGSPGACAGAERMIVVGQLPDLSIGDINWVTPEDQRVTSYDPDTFSTFSADLDNEGDYPTWNPNGGLAGEKPYYGRSSWDSRDGDASPDEFKADGETGRDRFEANYAGDDPGPICRWTGSPGATTDGDLETWEYPCSYRRGQVLETPIFHEVRRDSDGPVLENGSTPSFSDREGDKTDALQNDSAQSVEINALDRYKRGGVYRLEVEAGQRGGESFVPESNENNNEGTMSPSPQLLAVDLAITDPRIVVETTNGTVEPPVCPEDDRCEAGATVELDPKYENTGDQALDGTSLLDRGWVGAIWHNDEDVANETLDRIPETDEDAKRLFNLEELVNLNKEGKHTIEIRLDHRDNYKSTDITVTHENGEVGERNEGNDCPDSPDDVDNTFCATFWIEDTQPPDIQSTTIVSSETEDGVPQVHEGETVTFEAVVQDAALQNVTALFHHTNDTNATFEDPDGNTFTELELTPSDDGDNLWTAETELRGDLDRYVYKVLATDGVHYPVSDGTEFDLAGLPVEIETGFYGEWSINGQQTVAGPDAPRYQGNLSEPENYFNVSMSVNGTEVEPEDSIDNKQVVVERPNGSVAYSVTPNTLHRCVIQNAAGDNESRTGGDCEEGPGEDEQANWTMFWVNSTFPNDDTREDLDLDWAGSFNVTYQVEDKFGRNHTKVKAGTIQDRLNPNGQTAPELENASVSPTAVEPGGTVEASAVASDVLRVHNVTLNVTKPGNPPVTVRAPLDIDQLHDESTRNGSYAAEFDVDPRAEYFDRGGTYEVHLAAEDFARNVNESDPISLVVNDTDHPEVVELETSPSEAQEVGGNVTWEAEIADQTAVQPPTLNVQRPEVPDETLTMEFDEGAGVWTAGPLNATSVNKGTWTYTLTVKDYTGKQTTASGEIRIEDNLAPQDENWAPNVQGPDGASYGPPQPTISVRVVDFGDGVNKSSIAFSVNGNDRTGDAEITAIPDVCSQCFRVNYTAPDPFEAGSTVDVAIEATDLSDAEKASGKLRHQFKVDGEAPDTRLDMGPAVTRGDQRVIGLSTDVNVSVVDSGAGAGLTEVTVVKESSGASQTIKVAGGEGTFRLQDFDQVVKGHGVYQIQVEATDAVGNTAEPVQQRVIFDKLGPSIEVFAKPGKPRELVFANVTDDSEVQQVLARYSIDGGTEQTLSLEESNGTWSVRLFNQRTEEPFQEGSRIEFTVEATDLFGNVRSSSQKNFTAGDSPPEIEFTNPEEGDELSDRVELTWTAQDPETARENLKISLFFKKPDGKFQEIPGAQDIRNRGSYQLDTTTLPNGDVTLQVFVLDGQNFAADEVNVTVRNLGETFSAPEVQGADRVDGTNVLAPGQETTFRVQIDGPVQRAWANITKDGESVQSIELENAGGSTWRGSFNAPSEKGNYSVSLAASTSEGPQQAPDAYGFTVQGSPSEADNFIPEWTLLTALTATAVALGALGLRNKWS